jgi:hypothetical protein
MGSILPSGQRTFRSATPSRIFKHTLFPLSSNDPNHDVKTAFWIDADHAGAFLGQHAIVVLGLVLTSISGCILRFRFAPSRSRLRAFLRSLMKSANKTGWCTLTVHSPPACTNTRLFMRSGYFDLLPILETFRL